VHDALDLCLECKACKAECPSKVDMAKVKYEFLQQYYDAHGTPLSVRAIGNVASLAPLAQRVAPLANAVLPLKPVRWLNEKLIGVDARRTLPTYAREHFGRWFSRHAAQESDAPRGEVALFADTWTMYNDTSPGRAAVQVLEHLGYRVTLVTYGCCGRPQISKGLLREARKTAQQAVANLMPYVERGVPVVGLEPSCVTAFQDDYRDLIPGPETERVASHVLGIEQFLAKAWTQGHIDPSEAFQRSDTPMMLHGHCQQKAVMGTSASKALLEWVSSDVRELDAGCCGMAGSFGYGHHDVSMAIGERRLFPAVREHDGETAAPGFSCRHQIKDGTGRDVPHVIELLARAIKPAAQA
jgi:Fe-S oxidoreductase